MSGRAARAAAAEEAPARSNVKRRSMASWKLRSAPSDSAGEPPLEALTADVTDGEPPPSMRSGIILHACGTS